MRIGIDSGGTFTDFVVLRDDGSLESFKLRSNPQSPASVILEGIRRATKRKAEIVHGSTVATNALLERKGARTAFVTTKGFEDILAIGRQNRPELYNLTPPLPRLLVEPELCFGADERILFDGSVERPLRLNGLREKIERSGAESIAICLLHSYRNDAHERALLNSLEGCGYISASCDVSPEFREFERASATVINAYVGPLMDRYLGTLEAECPWPIAVMQSNGGLLTAHEARRNAVRTILSGPAGGIVGAVRIASLAKFEKALTFDMGGTSTDVALASRNPRLTTEGRVDTFPVRVPMLDIHTVGAGGGSIARVDSGGSLRVGPESAGASPGPACYGVGDAATVTDAHVALGRIAADQLAGGQVHIDIEAAQRAVARVGEALGIDTVSAAAAIIRIANSNMEHAIRAVSVERGEDPRDFPLVAFGGCGGLHACEIAEQLGIRVVLVPAMAGALSALGMLLADRMRDYSIGVLGVSDYQTRFRALERKARADVRGATLSRFADVRYAGQSYELTIPWGGDFHREHHRVYGYSDSKRPIQIVTLRLRASVAVKAPDLRAKRKIESAARRVWVGGRWRQLTTQSARGPALIADYGSTTLVPPGWNIRTDSAGTLVLRRR
ncbi:MAG TPA: hydantoinase/oxoprolinase family protein [Bryobacteraceae bacterium]|nr:hydantoinase/oxoprolinase family protein [Bryobacteraceae bacterium]